MTHMWIMLSGELRRPQLFHGRSDSKGQGQAGGRTGRRRLHVSDGLRGPDYRLDDDAQVLQALDRSQGLEHAHRAEDSEVWNSGDEIHEGHEHDEKVHAVPEVIEVVVSVGRKLQQELAEKEDLGESDGARGTRPSEDAGHENSQI